MTGDAAMFEKLKCGSGSMEFLQTPGVGVAESRHHLYFNVKISWRNDFNCINNIRKV